MNFLQQRLHLKVLSSCMRSFQPEVHYQKVSLWNIFKSFKAIQYFFFVGIITLFWVRSQWLEQGECEKLSLDFNTSLTVNDLVNHLFLRLLMISRYCTSRNTAMILSLNLNMTSQWLEQGEFEKLSHGFIIHAWLSLMSWNIRFWGLVII